MNVKLLSDQRSKIYSLVTQVEYTGKRLIKSWKLSKKTRAFINGVMLKS